MLIRVNEGIKKLIDELSANYTIQGVQPSDLADAVFEKPYSKVYVNKEGELIVMTVVFYEDEDEVLVEHKMRYTYNADKYILKIEQKVGARNYKVQWDRLEAIKKVVAKLSKELSRLNTWDVAERFIATIPCDFGRVAGVQL